MTGRSPSPRGEGRGQGEERTPSLNVVSITDDHGAVLNADMLAAAEAVHRQLRPHLPEDYVGRMEEVFANGGRMAVAVVDARVAGIAVYRVLEKTFTGRELYCDDLVTDEKRRSTGIGHALIGHLEDTGRRLACDVLALDSGTQRQDAHRFYFREGLPITSFHFSRKLGPPPPATENP